MAYFDNSATTFPKPEVVYNGLDEFNRNYAMNINRGQYSKSIKAGKMVEDTRGMLLDLFNANGSHSVIFTPSATISLNMIIQGIDYYNKKYIYISPFEHNSVLRPLNYMLDRYDFEVIELAVNREKMEYDLEAIKYQFQNKKPDVVIVSHASNVCGIIAPIEEIFNLAKQKNAITITDMSQTAGLLSVNLKEVQADFVIFAGHKTLYSMLGIAGFLIKKGVSLQPIIYGGTGVMSALSKQPETLPEKYEVGSLNTPAVASLYYSLRWINQVGIEKIKNTEDKNRDRLFNLLSSYDNIRIIGNSKSSVGIISCVFDNISPDNIQNILAEKNISVRTGLHCSPNAHKFLGTFPAGTVRFSISYFTEDKDFKELKEALDYIEENS